MAKSDLSDAYRLVNIHKNLRKYLRFEFENKIYEYICPHYGLSTAPLVFTKITKPILFFLRSAGIISTVYIDDFLLFGNCLKICQNNVKTKKYFLVRLGFLINETKSVLEPASQLCTFLGVNLDSRKMCITLTKNKRDAFYTETECELSETCFLEITEKFGTPEIDLFATIT